MALAVPGRTPVITDGRVEGRIGFEEKGVAGFGYDPLFIPDGYACTFAEMDSEEKNKISHRGRALMALKAKLD
jgi:XTP/dITP diphosphohydrolase